MGPDQADLMRLWLDFHGVLLELTAEGPSGARVLENLKADFACFCGNPGTGEPRARIEILERAAPASPRGRLFPAFSTKSCRTYGLWGRSRVCDYGQGAVVQARNAGVRLFRVFGGDTDYLYEICYTLVLSVSGEALDLLGFHRVHALGLSVTVGRNEAAGIVVLPSGGGKSAMAALLLDKEPRLRVFSDETPLLRRGRIYPFPTRIALRPEVLRALIPQANGRLFRRKRYPEKILLDILPQQVARSAPLSFVMVGVPGYPRAEIRKGRSSTSFRALAETMVVGLGVAQMAEHMLRLQAVPGLAEIAFSRLVEAIRVCRCCEHYLFLMSENARENSRALREFLVKRD